MEIIKRGTRHVFYKQYENFCKKCGSLLRFNTTDVKNKERPISFFKRKVIYKFVTCPVCFNEIKSSEFIPYPPPSGGPTEQSKTITVSQ